MSDSGYYRQHVFVCTNQRPEGRACCQDHGAESAREQIKNALKVQYLHGKGEIRVSSSGCLGRCTEGPVMVVYPQGDWYSWKSEQDLSEIIQALIDGEQAERLMI